VGRRREENVVRGEESSARRVVRPCRAAPPPAGLAVVLVAWLLAPGVALGQQRNFTFYVQQSFPKQTRTNQQIDQINQMFGTDFDTWDDVVNLSVGGQLFWPVSERWKVGVELDYSRGAIDGTATVATEAGPARLKFEQKYSVFTNVLAVAHFLPCPSCRPLVPFVLAGLGVGYEKDRTTLTLRNDYVDESLRVDNDGTFPVFTVGVGVDAYMFGRSDWYLEAGTAYYWGRLKHHVAAGGSLAPSPQVLADTDSSGPNYWLGIGTRF
jgi:hypothetical protein